MGKGVIATLVASVLAAPATTGCPGWRRPPPAPRDFAGPPARTTDAAPVASSTGAAPVASSLAELRARAAASERAYAAWADSPERSDLWQAAIRALEPTQDLGDQLLYADGDAQAQLEAERVLTELGGMRDELARRQPRPR